jgi:predicted CopG family antitoxin
MKTSIKIEEDTYHELFELKCAWRLKSFDETIKKLLQKAKKRESEAQ